MRTCRDNSQFGSKIEETSAPFEEQTACSVEQTDESEAVGAEEGAVQQTPRVVPRERVWEYVKRTIFLVVGLFIMSFGVGLSIRATLGTSPISGIPYVLNLIVPVLSVGTTTIIVNVGIVLLQVVLLRRRFPLLSLLQIPVCVVFGLLTDLALACMTGVTPQTYWGRWLICLAGIVLVAIGVSCEVTAKVTTLPGEGLVLALCKLLPKVKFGTMKVIVDCSLVLIAALLSLLFLHGLYAVREGTVAAALLVGLLAKQLNKVMLPLGNRLFHTK